MTQFEIDLVMLRRVLAGAVTRIRAGGFSAEACWCSDEERDLIEVGFPPPSETPWCPLCAVSGAIAGEGLGPHTPYFGHALTKVANQLVSLPFEYPRDEDRMRNALFAWFYNTTPAIALARFEAALESIG